MIIGITKKEKYNRIESVIKNGFIRFAWMPVTLHNGTYIWLEKYWADTRRKDRDYPHDLMQYPLWRLPYICSTNNYDLKEAVVIKLKRMGN